MQPVELLHLDLTAQLALIDDGKVTADELTAFQLDWIHHLNPLINAFISIADNARCDEPEGLLRGAAVAVKDNINVAGFTTTAGLSVLKENRVHTDASAVARLRQAGGRFIGKLNMSEGALGASNHNAHFGDCFNPFDLALTPGGSSGGSAAAVASGMVSLALGTDTMGSVRIPASYCGVFGFKASRGAISNAGTVPCGRVMDTVGPIARSARDLSLAFSVMQGYDPNCPRSVPMAFDPVMPSSPVLLVPDDLPNLGVEDDIIKDFEANLEAFVDMGCQLRRFSFAHYDFGAARRAGLILCEADMRHFHAAAWDAYPDDFSDYLRNLLSYIDRKTPMDVMRAEVTLDNAVLTARTLFSQGDFLLLPTAPQRAFPMAGEIPVNQADLTGFANQAGLCAVSVPMLSDNPLPAGMQIVGQFAADKQVLALAEMWEQHVQFTFTIPQTLLSAMDNN
ncbi:amidase [Aestuariibacter sp. A3R04]|uniref:amidase n=1 Tax=Aestuariibacter sp. A3R04 TaxID=2841571 RepID=UPI001C08D177|nr:amidase [Aestuariibacter sp. A3R04]MBU3023522.1 amidase [Aestuariibacter sp. A3R04]